MGKLDIKQEMRAIDTKNRSWYNSLSDDERKQVSPWLLMRYTSSAQGSGICEHYLDLTNEAVNVHFNTLRKHPYLQFQLMQVVGIGQSVYHPWLQPGKAQKKNKLHSWIAEKYTNFNDDEIELFASLNSKEDMKQLMQEYGMTDKEIKEVLK